MAGIYLHIPFCKQACHYCDFHFSTSMRLKGDLLAALKQELVLQRGFLGGQTVESIYFGGGTPSLLSGEELLDIFDVIYAHYPVAEGAEVTLEANPDDLTAAQVQALRHTPVNRLSIGIQSFSEADLRFMNRAHNAEEAKTCLSRAQDAGFDDLTIDLIYGAPTTSDAQWQENVGIALGFGVPHLSCYNLTVEPGTALGHMVSKGKVADVDEEQSARQMEWLMATMAERGYEHYEVSNFALPGRYARHNTSYWQGAHYLGVGPSAHSFDGLHRQWNVANNPKYIAALREGQLPFEREALRPGDRYNEYLLTGLRTQWGVTLDGMAAIDRDMPSYFEVSAAGFVADGLLLADGRAYKLSRAGFLLADRIASALFWVDGEDE